MVLRIDAGRQSEQLSFSDDVRAGGNALGAAAMGAAADLGQIAVRAHNMRVRELEEQQQQADQVYLAKTSGEMRVKWAKQLDDDLAGYDGADGGFAQGYIDRYQQEAQKTLEGAPERIRQQLNLELIRQGDVLASAAYEGEGGRRQAYTLNTINTATDAEAEAVVTTPDLFWDSVEGLGDMVAAAPKAVQAKLLEEKRQQYAGAYAEGLMAKDPQRLIDELTESALDPYIDAKSKATWLKAAAGAVDRQETEARLERERATRELEGEARELSGRAVAFFNAGLSPPADLLKAARDAAGRAGKAGLWEAVELARYRASKEKTTETKASAKAAMGDLSDALKLGLTPSQELVDAAAAAVQNAKSSELQNDLVDMLALAGKQREFAFMTPAAAAKREAELRAMPATRQTTKELQLLENVTTAREKAISGGDLVGWVAANGVPLKALQPGDADLGDAVAKRAEVMAAAARELGAPFQLFGKNEKTVFARALEQMPADKRLGVLSTMAMQLGSNAGAALKDISKSAPADANAGMLLMMGRGQAARDVVNGLGVIKQNPKAVPARGAKEIQAIEAQVIGRALPPELADVREGVIESARAIYAAGRARGGARDEEFDEGAFARAIREAAGGDGDKGGLGKVNNQDLVLPPQLSADDVKTLLASGEVFGENWFKYSYGDPSANKPGGPPAWQDPKTSELRRFEPGELRNVRLVTKGQGLYWVSVTDPATGASYVLDLDTGAPFVLDLRQAEAPNRATSQYERPRVVR
jgi:hypothetical protein